MANKIGVTRNDDGSFAIKPSKYSKEITYKSGGGYEDRKNFLRAAEEEGLSIPEGKWEQREYFEKLEKQLQKAGKYNWRSIDASHLPSPSDSDEGGSEPKRSGWF